MVRTALFSMFLMLSVTAFAQDGLTGRVYENQKHISLPGIVVRNLNTQGSTVTDRTGGFAIPAKIGDVVTFTGFSYRPDTLYVKDLKYIEILLDLKQNMLKEVKVTASEVNVGSLKAAPRLSPIASDAVVYHQDAKGNYDGGLTFNIFDSHSAENKRKKEAQFNKDEDVKTQIAEIFSPEYLKNYIPLTGQEMTNFIVEYTPDIKTFTSHDFNITLYLNNSYTEFMKLPAEKRQSKDFQRINKPN